MHHTKQVSIMSQVPWCQFHAFLYLTWCRCCTRFSHYRQRLFNSPYPSGYGNIM